MTAEAEFDTPGVDALNAALSEGIPPGLAEAEIQARMEALDLATRGLMQQFAHATRFNPSDPDMSLRAVANAFWARSGVQVLPAIKLDVALLAILRLSRFGDSRFELSWVNDDGILASVRRPRLILPPSAKGGRR